MKQTPKEEILNSPSESSSKHKYMVQREEEIAELE